MSAPAPQQLRMLWPMRQKTAPPVNLPPDYRLRQLRDEDEERYLALMVAAGFTYWNHEKLLSTRSLALRDGYFVIEHTPTGAIVATALAQRGTHLDLRDAGELGWVAGDSNHRGRGLGLAVCAAATARLLAENFAIFYLLTDDFRLPAISIYLKLGYRPWLFAPDMPHRWETVHQQLAANSR